MKKFPRKQIRFENQIYLVQLGGIALTVVICALVSLTISISSQIQIIEDNLMTIANTLATGPTIINTAALGCATDDCKAFMQELLDEIPMADQFAIFSNDGTLIYHSDPACIGESITEQEREILQSGEDTIDTKKGIDQRYYRVAYTPIKDMNGKTLGYLAISILYSRQFLTIRKLIPAYIIAIIILLAMGSFLAKHLLKQIRQKLKGYDPDQFANIYDGNTNVLNIIDEGVIAINTDKRITVINHMGCEILGLPVIPYDRVPIQDVMPESKLPSVLETEQAIYNEHMVLHGKNLLITHLPLYSGGQLIGAASLFHSSQIMNELAKQLEDANNMVDTLRAFNHEFMNKLHVILGYLETDHIAEAKKYLLQSSMESSRSISQIARVITHQGIAALIIGKAIRASELDISLNLVPESYCRKLTEGISSNVYVTILGNLLQNSIEELNSCDHILKEIQLTVFIDRESTYISVLDTGRGMPREMVEKITERDVSTKGSGHGTGLYLVKKLITELHGSLKIESDPGEGTVATVMIQKKDLPIHQTGE